MKKMNVLVACEYSAMVREAFIAKGHNAVSCDYLPTEQEGPHIQGDVTPFLGPNKWNNYEGWHLMVAHPPCTYIAASGLHWNKKDPARAAKTEDGLGFVCTLFNAPIPLKCIENPVGCIGTRIYLDTDGIYKLSPTTIKNGVKASQTVQPYNYGHNASKATQLWLVGLPTLKNGIFTPPRIVCPCGAHYPYGYDKDGCGACGGEAGFFKARWDNQTDSGQNKLPPSEDRWKLRSTTYSGIAEAMAQQWGTEQTKATLF